MPKQTKDELIAEIERLASIITAQEKELQHLRSRENQMNEVLSAHYWAQTKNERGAGRKPTPITDEMKNTISNYKQQGMTFKQISEKMGLSVGFIHKVYQKHCYS